MPKIDLNFDLRAALVPVGHGLNELEPGNDFFTVVRKGLPEDMQREIPRLFVFSTIVYPMFGMDPRTGETVVANSDVMPHNQVALVVSVPQLAQMMAVVSEAITAAGIESTYLASFQEALAYLRGAQDVAKPEGGADG
jgi:hypothetical protein